MTGLWAISRTTFFQTIRQPIYFVLILVTFALLVVNLPLSGWTVSSDAATTDQKLMESVGLSTLMVTGLLIAAFSAAAALGREIEDKTALTVVSKPVTRATFVAGKFLGVAGAVVLAYYICSLAFLMTVRHGVMPTVTDPYDWPVIVLGCSALAAAMILAMVGNLLYNWTFTSAVVWASAILMSIAMGVIAFVGKGWTIVSFAHDIPGQLLMAMTLMLMAVLVFAAVAVAASTRLGQVMTLLVCFGVFIVGSMYRTLFGPETQEVFAGRVLGAVVPNLTAFYMLDAMMGDTPIPGSYLLMALCYCVLYVGGILALGIALFQTRPLEAQGASASMPGPVGTVAWTGRAAAVACGIAGFVLVSLGRYHNPAGLGIAGGLLAAAVATWIIWGMFGRGVRWVYWLVGVVSIAVLGLSGAAIVYARTAGMTDEMRRLTTPAWGAAVVSVCVLLVLVLPGTRRHFRPEGLSSKPPRKRLSVTSPVRPQA